MTEALVPPAVPEITLLNAMLGADFPQALDRHVEFGLRWLDLKDGIFGKSFDALTAGEAEKAAHLIRERGLEVYTLSSSLCHEEVEMGESAFRALAEAQMKRILAVAPVLRPKSVRLLSARSSRREEFGDSVSYLDRTHPWVYAVYRDCIDALAGAGYTVFVENEAHHNILSSVREVRGFFERLERPERVSFTWDIQNFWQMGTFPEVEIYEALEDLIGYLHFKGGRADAEGRLAWASSLAQASWSVAAIADRAMKNPAIPMFCLNPSHSQRAPGYQEFAVVEEDIRFLQQLIEKSRHVVSA